MPEGHTIHRVARDHSQRYLGQQLAVSSPQGRFKAGARKIDGGMLGRIEAYGKHLFYWWERERVLHIHLGLYGKFRNHRSPPPEPRGAVRLRVVGESHAFDLNGPSACELLTPGKRDALVERLGADPLRKDADLERAWNRISRSRAAIGKLLLDQSVIAGVGNVYRAEALFANRFDPERAGNTMSREEFDTLWQTLVGMLRTGVKYNRIITADPEAIGKPYSRMNRAERLLCYKREFCPRCEAQIRTWELGNRKMYACPACQAER
jgi:endonuclease-8